MNYLPIVVLILAAIGFVLHCLVYFKTLDTLFEKKNNDKEN